MDYELSLACAGFLTELSRHYHARVRLDSSHFPSSNVHYANPMTRTGMIMNYLVANIQDVTLGKNGRPLWLPAQVFVPLDPAAF
ncbi:hypothetical protein [Lactobacillus delbrueckii]|uniref:hypothetical protein n=1 Tax=Lactobacillus delbrueckii TaxID=1584 RepID=UPI001EE4DB02|nr:hypothetical protein [Lactobacillus delbrueckii]